VRANVDVTRISGVNVVRTKTRVYPVAGPFSTIAGMVLTFWLGGASVGGPPPLCIVGAVVLGGTSPTGKRGNLPCGQTIARLPRRLFARQIDEFRNTRSTHLEGFR
jgi:ribose/xylose/arabinose/galactoside ABC-type transport system permease subunit